VEVFDREAAGIEAVYRETAFIKELCVVNIDSGNEGPELWAAVVPDMERLRARRIVNVGDLLRFEIEGRSIFLTPERRVSRYRIWFDALPRTDSGEVDRRAVRDRLLAQRQARTDAPAPNNEIADVRAREIADCVAGYAGVHRVTLQQNLELDLGLDSVSRIELLTALEQRCSLRVPDNVVHEVFTVEDLVRKLCPCEAPTADAEGWARLLQNRPPQHDEHLRWMVKTGGIASAVLFGAFRSARSLLVRVAVTGLEHLPPSPPFILAPNHQSYLDPFYLSSVLPYRVVRRLFVVGAGEYFETPLTAWLARLCKLVPIDPDMRLVPALQAAALGLERGKVLLMFPEGERSIDGTVKRFKRGAAILARELQVPIVPVAIRGAYEVWPRNRPFNRRALRYFGHHTIRIAFGNPAAVTVGDSYAAATLALQERVEKMWQRLPASARQSAATSG
jgi:long-chain acyl-CoA synthetase